MIKFKLPNEPEEIKVNVDLKPSVDYKDTGDIDLKVNGMSIAWISAGTGTLNFYLLPAIRQEELKKLGFMIEYNRISNNIQDY